MGGDDALAAAALTAVRGHGEPLDVADMGHGDHHVLFGDQILDRELPLIGDDLGAALVAEAVRQLRELLLEDLEAPRLGGEDLFAFLDELADFLQLLLELGDLEGGEPGEPHVEDFRRLLLGQLEALAQGRVGRGHVLRLANDPHHLVDVVDGDLQAFENVLAVLGPRELELGAARDDGVAVLDEVLEQLFQGHLLGRAVDQRQHDRAEGRLHLGVLVQLVQHHRGDGVALQIDDDPHPLAVGVVLDVGDAVELLVVGELGDLRDEVRLVHLIGDLGDHDLLLPRGLFFLDHGAGPQHHPPAALLIAFLDPFASVDDRAGREVGALDELPEILGGRVRVVHQMIDRFDRLGEVVRRDVRGHADGDARRPVHDQVGEPRRQHRRLLQPVVEVGDEVDGVLVDVLEHRHRDAREARFGVAVRGGRVAVHGAEVALAVHQRVAQREVLHHAHQRVVDRHVAVGVVLAEHVADHRGALLVGAAGDEPQLVHRVQDAAVHGLQPIAHVGQRALHDHAHRVVEERLPHLVFDEAGQDAFAGVRCGHESRFGLGGSCLSRQKIIT